MDDHQSHLIQARERSPHTASCSIISIGISPEYRSPPIEVVLMGGSRNGEDAERVTQLRPMAKDTHVEVGDQRGTPGRTVGSLF